MGCGSRLRSLPTDARSSDDVIAFESYGKVCAYGHPGSQIDAAMAKNGSAFIKTTMGW